MRRHILGGAQAIRNAALGTVRNLPALAGMSEKRLSKGGDKVVLADAARAERKLRHRPKQLPALAIFVAISIALAVYKLFFEL